MGNPLVNELKFVRLDNLSPPQNQLKSVQVHSQFASIESDYSLIEKSIENNISFFSSFGNIYSRIKKEL